MSLEDTTENILRLGDLRDVRDLDVFLARAAGVRDGVARLVARGTTLAVHVAAAFPLMLGSAAPTIVGQRGLHLRTPATADVVVPIAEVRDRLARMTRVGSADLGLPPSRPSAPWTATVPLSAVWQRLEPVSDDVWTEVGRDVAAQVRDSLPEQPGQAMVFQAREALWSRADDRLGDGALTGAAFAAQAYGFLGQGSTSRRFAAGPWQRLSASGGTVLWRAG